ncbi:MAG: hypothetical protein IT380_02795 [Myxococcales bacterium]|nr:hypothetical protein [Myxococcales bacterium]
MTPNWSPRFPFQPSLVDPVSGTRVWLFDEALAVVDQTPGDMTMAVARFLVETVDGAARRRWPDRKIRFVHDWRSCVRYEVEARERLIEWGRASKPYVAQATFQISPDASPFLRIAGTTAVALLRVLRLPIDMVDDLDPICRELSARQPVAPLALAVRVAS